MDPVFRFGSTSVSCHCQLLLRVEGEETSPPVTLIYLIITVMRMLIYYSEYLHCFLAACHVSKSGTDKRDRQSHLYSFLVRGAGTKSSDNNR